MLHAGHFVAIFGGAVSGAEAAHELSSRHIYSAVFDQHALPYGKIEDGLPKWHVKLRDKEERLIDDHLDNPYVYYVPRAGLGQEISLDEVQKWGFSAILLATGAWQDRPLPVKGVDDYIGKGLVYQNPFVAWFNHNHEPEYQGEQFEVVDGATVVGGGLASIDVVKILMIETVREALAKKGHDIDMLTIEKEGVATIIGDLGFTLADLGVKGCTLYYRRRTIDMPLIPMPPDPSPEKLEKAKLVRQKVLQNAMEKYLFNFEECCMPVDKIVEEDRLAGLVFRKTKIENERAVPIQGSDFEVRAPVVISSIGSIPKPIPGISTDDAVFRIKDEETAQLEGFHNVFALGNAVTGRGNIKESRIHGRKISHHVAENFLEWQAEYIHQLVENKMAEIDQRVDSVVRKLDKEKILSVERVRKIVDRLDAYRKRVGYSDYPSWVKKHTPVRLEQLLQND